jgi:hypothetical protein
MPARARQLCHRSRHTCGDREPMPVCRCSITLWRKSIMWWVSDAGGTALIDPSKPVAAANEKAHHPRHAAVVSEHRRTRSGSASMRRGSMSSVHGSRTPTPKLEAEEYPGVISRKGSTSSDTSEKKRKKLATAVKNRPRVESRSVTPEIPSPLAKQSTPKSGPASARGSP